MIAESAALTHHTGFHSTCTSAELLNLNLGRILLSRDYKANNTNSTAILFSFTAEAKLQGRQPQAVGP